MSCDTGTRGGTWCPLCLVQVNDTPVFHSHGEMALSRVLALRVGCPVTLAHWGEPGVPSLSRSSQRYSSLSLSWPEMALSRVLA